MERRPQVVLYGWNITNYSTTFQFLVLAGGALGSSLGFAYLQEKVTTLPNFTHYDFMTFLTTLTFTVCGVLERFFTNDLVRKAPLRDYFFLSVCTLGGMYFTNFSLSYLNYTTRIVFKSSKVIPVMLMGVIMQRKKYILYEYLSVFILVGGIIFFALGDAKESPNYNPLGIILISIGVILDAVTCNYEEKNFFHKRNCSPAEVMTFASLFGTVFSFIGLAFTHNLFDFFNIYGVENALKENDFGAYVMRYPEVIYNTCLFSTLGYSSSMFILQLIKVFGATNAEIVKSLRKILSVMISFIAFTKPFTWFHLYGTVLFVFSTLMGIHVTNIKKAKTKELKEKTYAANENGNHFAEKQKLLNVLNKV